MRDDKQIKVVLTTGCVIEGNSYLPNDERTPFHVMSKKAALAVTSEKRVGGPLGYLYDGDPEQDEEPEAPESTISKKLKPEWLKAVQETLESEMGEVPAGTLELVAGEAETKTALMANLEAFLSELDEKADSNPNREGYEPDGANGGPKMKDVPEEQE